MGGSKEKLPSAESYQSPVDRFNNLIDGVKFFAGDKHIMGSYTVPIMRVEEDMVRISAFLPDQTKPSLYSPSILYQTLIERPWDKSTFLAPSSEIYLKANQLESDEGLDILEQLESVFKRYEAASQTLSADEAEALGFPEEFIKTLKTAAI